MVFLKPPAPLLADDLADGVLEWIDRSIDRSVLTRDAALKRRRQLFFYWLGCAGMDRSIDRSVLTCHAALKRRWQLFFIGCLGRFFAKRAGLGRRGCVTRCPLWPPFARDFFFFLPGVCMYNAAKHQAGDKRYLLGTTGFFYGLSTTSAHTQKVWSRESSTRGRG